MKVPQAAGAAELSRSAGFSDCLVCLGELGVAMNEAKWHGCANPEEMLVFLGNTVSGRKLTLFACACCRRGTIDCKHSWEELLLVENFVDGRIPPAEFAAALEELDGLMP